MQMQHRRELKKLMKKTIRECEAPAMKNTQQHQSNLHTEPFPQTDYQLEMQFYALIQNILPPPSSQNVFRAQSTLTYDYQ